MDYLFICLTSYQLYIAAFLISKIPKGEDDNIILIVSRDQENNYKNEKVDEIIQYQVNRSSAYSKLKNLLLYGKWLIRFSKVGKSLKEKRKTFLFVFNDRDALTKALITEIHKSNKKNLIYLVEEGTAAYEESDSEMEDNCNWRVLLKQSVYRILGSEYCANRYIGENPFIDHAIVTNRSLFTKLKKSKGKKVFEISAEQLFGYKNIKNYLKSINVTIEPHCLNYDVLILGQAFEADGEMNPYENRMLEIILDLLEKQFSVMIKPHPRDGERKYNEILKKHAHIFLLQGNLRKVPIECFGNWKSVKYIISYNSTAAINLKRLFPHLNIINLYNIAEFQSYKLDKNCNSNKLQEEFIQQIVCPYSLDELKEYLKKKEEKHEF